MKKQLKQCRTAKDFIGYARYKDASIEQCCKGVKIYGSKPGYAELHSNHTKELATGTRAALIKAFIAIGLAGSVGCMLLCLGQLKV